ncbi:MAG: hypothetical protein ACF8TS_18000 [Maioricimonas sp. JB049]
MAWPPFSGGSQVSFRRQQWHGSQGRVVGGVGIMIDEYEYSARVFKVITIDDCPVRFLLSEVEQACRTE